MYLEKNPITATLTVRLELRKMVVVRKILSTVLQLFSSFYF